MESSNILIIDDERVICNGCRMALSDKGHSVDVCMTGLSNLEQTEHALEALRSGPMSEEELAWMRRVGTALYRRR